MEEIDAYIIELIQVWAGKGECNRNSAYMKLW